jgi:hypothetical protein
MDDKMDEIRSELAQNGIRAVKVGFEKDMLILGFPARDAGFNPEDLLTVRNALTVLRKINLDYSSFNLEIMNSLKAVIYDKSFTDIYSKPVSENIKNEVIDTTLASFKIKYALVKSNVENLGIKVFSSEENSDLKGKTANIKVKSDKSSLEGVMRCLTDIINEVNEQGGGIYCYNIEVVDENSLPIYMISKDLFYSDEIVWAA